MKGLYHGPLLLPLVPGGGLGPAQAVCLQTRRSRRRERWGASSLRQGDVVRLRRRERCDGCGGWRRMAAGRRR